MVRFLYPEFPGRTAESMCEELSRFSLTVMVQNNVEKIHVFGNFGRMIRRVWGRTGSVPVSKAPGRALIDDVRA
jgi:hypothetical protein